MNILLFFNKVPIKIYRDIGGEVKKENISQRILICEINLSLKILRQYKLLSSLFCKFKFKKLNKKIIRLFLHKPNNTIKH